MWSQSKMAMNSPWVFFSASLMLPALAWRLWLRITQLTPTSSANCLNSSRRPSSRMWMCSLSIGQSMAIAASTVGLTTFSGSL